MPDSNEIAQIFPEMAKRFLPEKATGIDATIQFNLHGENGGHYWLKIKEQTCNAGEGELESPSMTMTSSADDYWAIVNDELNPMQAFMQGKVKVKGDMGLALKLMTLFKR